MTASYYYTQDISDFSTLIHTTKDNTQGLFQRFKQDITDLKHPILDCVNDTEVFDSIDNFIQKQTHKFKTFVIFGTGGSSLGTRAITAWAGFNHNPLLNNLSFNIVTADNLDDLSFGSLMNNIDIETTCFLIISKSGNTLETNIQVQILIDLLQKKNQTPLLQTNAVIITEINPQKNILAVIAEKWGIPVLPHSLKIGGRYSVLTMTGLLPTAIMGLDYKAIMTGAKSVIDDLHKAQTFEESMPCLGAAAMIGAEQQKHLLTHIFAAYGDRFYEFAFWIRQLWAESLGKDAKGGLFVPSLNPLDQHSQLQMYYDGIDNKTYTFIECHLKNTKQTPLNFGANSSFAYLNNHTVHDAVHASFVGTAESLRSKGRLIRTFGIDDYTPQALGALMMHFIIETVFASYLLDVNPYNQPAVEDYKIRTKAFLSNNS